MFCGKRGICLSLFMRCPRPPKLRKTMVFSAIFESLQVKTFPKTGIRPRHTSIAHPSASLQLFTIFEAIFDRPSAYSFPKAASGPHNSSLGRTTANKGAMGQSKCIRGRKAARFSLKSIRAPKRVSDKRNINVAVMARSRRTLKSPIIVNEAVLSHYGSPKQN